MSEDDWVNCDSLYFTESGLAISGDYAICEECFSRDELAELKKSGRLTEILQAERDGRLVVLPCKVGDTVYTVDFDCRDNPDHSKLCFCWGKSCKKCDKAYLRVWENHTKTVNVRSIVAEMGLCGESVGFGKTVFLTRALAEEVLKNVQKEI